MMDQDNTNRKRYPSETPLEDPKRLDTQIRTFKKWLNWHLKQANARDVKDVLDIFRDTRNLYYLCKHLLTQKAANLREPLAEDASYLDRAIAMLEKLYGNEIASVIQTTVNELSGRKSWETETLVRQNWNEPTRSIQQNLTLLGLDSLWILIVAVCAGTGPTTNLFGSRSSSASTITRSGVAGLLGNTPDGGITSARTPCIDRWLSSQDERLMAWCVATTENYSGLHITNFTHSWRDGLAFMAIIHQSRPDLFDYQTRLEKTANQNLSLAFHWANSEFAAPRLLEPADMQPDHVDARATATFLLEFRKQIERDRKCRSKGILEIQTPAMQGDEQDLPNVTVTSRSSPTSTASTSESTWLEDALDEDLDEDGELPDVSVYDSLIEITLAWLLAMEERFAGNNLNAPEAAAASESQFHWDNYCIANLRQSPQLLSSQLTLDERNEVQALLGSSAEKLKRLHQKILIKVDEARVHFETHEDLTSHLARRQMSVGRCLRLGNRIIQVCKDKSKLNDANMQSQMEQTSSETQTTSDLVERLRHVDPSVIQRQNALLASRWNNLCHINQTMGRRMTNCLLRRQGMLLIAVRLQLEKLEAEQSRQAEMQFGPSIRELKIQLEANRNLEEGIEIGEILAVRLDNFIILVRLQNDGKEDASEVNNLETVIAELASRWSRLVDWVNTRFAKLQNALLHWRHFEEEVGVLTDWLSDRAEEMRQITDKCNGNHLGKPGVPGGSASASPVPRTEESSEAELQAIETYINSHEPRWAQLLASVDRRAQSLRDICGNTEEVSRLVETTMERLVSQWSQMAEPQLSVDDWLNQFSNDTEQTADRVSPHAEEKAGPILKSHLSSRVHKQPNPTEAKPADKKRSAESLLSVPKSPKIPCTDSPLSPSPTGYRSEFESKAEELLNWLDDSAEMLELMTMDEHRSAELTKSGETATEEISASSKERTDSEAAVKRISREMLEWRETMKRVMTMGERYREELLEADENVEELDQLFDEVDERWAYLDSLLVKAERHLRVTTNSKQFQMEVSKLLNRDEQDVAGLSEEASGTTAAEPMTDDVPVSFGDPIQNIESKMVQLNNQLSRVEEVIAGPILFTNPQDMEEQLDNDKNLMTDLAKEQLRFTTLVAQHEEALASNLDVKQRADAMVTRVTNICAHLQDHFSAVQEINEQVEFFMNQLEGIEKWLTEMRCYVDSVSQADLPSISDLHAQLHESCEAVKDMGSLKPTLLKVTEIATQLSECFKAEYSKIVKDRLTELHENWDQVNVLIHSTREQLESRLSENMRAESRVSADGQSVSSMEAATPTPNSPVPSPGGIQTTTMTMMVEENGTMEASSSAERGVCVDLTALEQWMTAAKQRIDGFSVIETQSQFEAMKDYIKTLNQEITDRRSILAALDTHTAVDLSNQSLSSTTILMTRAHFADLEAALGAERERLRAAIYHLEDFHALLSGEQRWFETVDSAIHRANTADYADLSDLTDELETFDRLFDEHSVEDEERLERLTFSLEEAKIMAVDTEDKLKQYKQHLAKVSKEVAEIQDGLRSTIETVQQIESTAHNLKSRLNEIKPRARETWEKLRVETTQFLNHLAEKISNNQGQKPLERFSKHSCQLCLDMVQKAFDSVKKLLEPSPESEEDKSVQANLERIQNGVEQIENQLDGLEIISLSPASIQASVDKARDMLNTMNNLKMDIDRVEKQHPKPCKTDALKHQLTELHDSHRRIVMTILIALGRLEDAMSPAQKLDDLVTELCGQVNGIEEVIDYLDTTDCPVSRRYMLQRIYKDLERLCQKGCLIDKICILVEQLKQITASSASKSTEEAFKSIEERISRVRATKDAFREQLEQIDVNQEEYTADSCEQPPLPLPENPLVTRIKLSVNQVIEEFLKPETQVSDTVRELAREIRDHLRSIILFNRYCLGSNASLHSTEDPGNKSQLLRAKDSESTVSERKALVKVYFRFTSNLFRQQRTYLGDRLRKLIVNAGDDGTNNRLQDLLRLQTAWHETNDKLDRRGEHMAQLEQQLTAAEQAMADYLRSPTEANKTTCISLIKHLEDTYGWKLSTDLAQIERIADGEVPPEQTQAYGPPLLEDGLLGKYEFILRAVAAYLNEIQFALELCGTGNVPEMKKMLQHLDTRFTECYRLLTDAANVLNNLTNDVHRKSRQPEKEPANSERSSGLSETEELIWLKVLFDTQKNRLDAYSLQFKLNHGAWKQLSEKWEQYSSNMEELRNTLSQLNGSVRSDVARTKLENAKMQLNCVESLERDLESKLELNQSANVPNGIIDSEQQRTTFVKPKDESLWNMATVRTEVKQVQEEFRELCIRHKCRDIVDETLPENEKINIEAVCVTTSPLQASTQPTSELTSEDETSFKTNEELGSYQNEVEVCLKGLAEETRWFTKHSGLVPSNRIKRQSDDILLANTHKIKPTTAAELRLDVMFWHSNVTPVDWKQPSDAVEFTPNWIKNKWSALEKLIEVTFEHEKNATSWCRKAAHLGRLLRNASDTQLTNAAYTKVLNRLESDATKLAEAVNVAQAALSRRRSFLTRWQSDLVELDTLLAEIKSLMNSYEVIGLGIKGETPSEWLADLRHKLTERDVYPRVTREHILTEFDPCNEGLGKFLTTLANSWNRVQEKLQTPEQSTMLVRVPLHIANQVQLVLREWDALKRVLNLPTEEVSLPTDQRIGQITRSTPIIATVVRAPNTWSVNLELAASPGSQRRFPTNDDFLSASSPALLKMYHEVEQLIRWLNAVTQFARESKSLLSDRFDQESMNRQLQSAKRVTSEGYSKDVTQIYHPAALQLKIQQFLTELNARRPHLDRIAIEKERWSLWETDEMLAGEVRAKADLLPKLWSEAEEQLSQRTNDLESVIAQTEQLNDLERKVDRWITKAESELDELDSTRRMVGASDESNETFVSPENARRRIQALLDSVHVGKELVDEYNAKAQELFTRFRHEDDTKLRHDLERLNQRWDQLNERVQNSTKFILEMANTETSSPDTEHVVLARTAQSSVRETSKNRANEGARLPDKVDSIERKVNRIAELHSDLNQHGEETPPGLTDKRFEIGGELHALQMEISQIYNQCSGSRSSDSDLSVIPPDMLSRLRELKEKVATLRQSLKTKGLGQDSKFLLCLKELNDWVAHRDAAFRAVVCPLNGNLLFILKQREIILNILTELEGKRATIEDTLHQGRTRYDDSRLGADSDFDSDGQEQADTTEQSKRRTCRRIRRYLHHLGQRWTALNENIFDYKQQLDLVSERLSNFHSLFNDTVEQVRSAHAVTLRWTAVQSLPVDRLASELEQTQTFYDACAPLTVLLNSLDQQIAQFREAQIAIDAHVHTETGALRVDLDHIRSITEARLEELNRALSSFQVSTPYSQPMLQTVPEHVQGRSPHVPDASAHLRQNQQLPEISASQFPLSDSVSSPWERCVHPSGTQVPYYKNHSTQDTQWDHPLLCEVMQAMKDYNVVRFADYRVALKLRKLQKTLCLDSLSISVLAENLKHIGHTQLADGTTVDPFDRSIYVPQMIECLTKLFQISNDNQHEQHYANDQCDDSQSGIDFYDVVTSSKRADSVRKPIVEKPSHDLHQSRASPLKCGRGLRRSPSHRVQPKTDTGERRSSLVISSADPTVGTSNRSSSLPDDAKIERPALGRRSTRARRSSSRSKRRLVTGPTKFPVNVCVDLTLNWLLNVYDRMRKGHIRALSFKVALTALCMADLVDKYRYLFSLIADPSGHVNEQRLGALLYECILIPRNLGEGNWSGKEDFANTVKSCYSRVLGLSQDNETQMNSPLLHSPGVPMRHFITWLRFGTPLMAWLPLLHRIMLAEQVVHHVRCGFCNKHPIIGLRYRCLWCLNFDLCQQCFFSGRVSRGHKLTHPMQEYCTNSTSGDSLRDFTRMVKNRLRSKDRASNADRDRRSGGKSTGSNRSRGRCCDVTEFGEDKPRPAPVYGSELNSLIQLDRATPMGTAWLDSATPMSMRNGSEFQTGRPMTSQLASTPKDRGLPPRAASDTKQMLFDSRLASRVTHSERFGRFTEPTPDEEHRLIAQYSRELRQQSEPDLNPVQSVNQTGISSLMDRSTISEGPTMGATVILPQSVGHSSLDRRQWNRSPAYVPSYNGPAPSYPVDSTRVYGRLGAIDNFNGSRFDPSYRSARQFGGYPLSSNPSLHRTAQVSSQNGIQRSFSLRARSQPPPEAGMNPPIQPPTNIYFDSRYQWQPTGLPPQSNFPHKMRSLEDERRALQMEYDRLRFSPTQNMSARLHLSQQRAARSPMQHTLPPQQQDYMRSNLGRSYHPRFPMHRPPSAGPPLAQTGAAYSNVATLPGRFYYNGSLGRTNSLNNGFQHPLESYGSEPRVPNATGYGFAVENDYGTTAALGFGSEVASEARLLRAHRERLELRMQQLEDQNKQLEDKLQRLRQHLVSGGGSGEGSNQTVTGSAGRIGVDHFSVRTQPSAKSSLRQRSASGGLALNTETSVDKLPRISGSIGELPTPTPSEPRVEERRTPSDSDPRHRFVYDAKANLEIL